VGETAAILLLLHVSLRCARMSVTCVNIFLLELLYVKFLCIMWLLVGVLTVLGVLCSLLFFVACLVLNACWVGLIPPFIL
jgi:hypothetical protein